ncbi:MAG: hypothetical protein ACRELF_00065, partial [Gemmataceae bacterium]
MTVATVSSDIERGDLQQAVAFAQRCFNQWHERGVIREGAYQAINGSYTTLWSSLEAGGPKPANIQLPSADRCWSCKRPLEANARNCDECGAPARTTETQNLRYFIFVCFEIKKFQQAGTLSLSAADACLTESNERIAALRRYLDRERIPMAVAVQPASSVSGLSAAQAERSRETAPSSGRSTAPPPQPRRNLMEILLDPRNIHMLLAFGGALMVVGLVILLWVNELLKPPVVAVGLGVVNAALLGAGWGLLRGSRYQMAGRAVTLLACLVLPLNLWYYHANGLITLDGHLWVAALVISALYAASALVLRDELFVYIFTAGVTLTGLLFLADLPPSPEKFWEIAPPATLLVVLGLLAIHTERAFPEQEGPFGRRRFGLAFFWSGHALLAAGLLLLLGAEIAGDWLYKPVFQNVYEQMKATPSPIVGELRWLALLLVVAATYAYIYSDLVVRRVGVYVYIAAATLLWALLLSLQLLNIALGMDALIAVLALTALAVNASQASVFRDSRYTRAFPILGVLLPLLAVALGLLVYLRALSPNLKGVWQGAVPTWNYVGAMLLTAVSCRFGAYLYRQGQPRLTAVYFFATAAATLVAATAFLAALGLNTWQQHAPWLMLLPIVYLIAARLYRGRSEEQPLLWVGHAATAFMLAASLASAVEGFALVQKQPLNLVLALFCAEAAVFYALATAFYRQVWTIHLSAAMACGAVWQVLTYRAVPAEFYTLTFALVGLGLLVAYRFALLERFSAGPLADAAFQSANTLLSLSFVAGLLLGLSRLATKRLDYSLVSLFAVLTVISLLSLALVRHAAWRRWYVVTTLSQAALTFLGITVLSELSLWQKLEIFSVVVGLLLLSVGHIGWYREQERENDMVSLSLLLGSLLVGVPLAAATLIDRSHDHLIVLNELGFLAAAVLLLTTGYLFQLKTTTLAGSALTALYFITLLI